jgi:hypothetical protein
MVMSRVEIVHATIMEKDGNFGFGYGEGLSRAAGKD